MSTLAPAWSVPATGKSAFGSYASLPVAADGIVYSQDLRSNVQAIDLDTGEVLWTKSYESPSLGPNGVVIAGGRVLGATAEAAFALDSATGEELWSVELVRSDEEGIDMAPGYLDGLVYVSTVPVTLKGVSDGGAIGVLWALDAATGEKLWHFDTVPEELWGNPEVNSGGGLWYQPSFDHEGSMYFGVGNPAPYPGTPEFPWGSSRPGPNLYTNSMVKLDAVTGALQWHYQQTPHDIYDWDFQDPPVLVDVGGTQLAIGAGKAGVVAALDRSTGSPVWTRSVGVHNGHDGDSILAMEGKYDELAAPVSILPGQLGGVIAPMATDGSKLFVPVVNGTTTVHSGSHLSAPTAASGELIALDLATGAIAWVRAFPIAAFGAPVAVNDLVFVTTADGNIYALDTADGQTAWQDRLPAGTNTGVTIAGDTMIAPAGLASDEGQVAQIVAYQLGEGAGDDVPAGAGEDSDTLTASLAANSGAPTPRVPLAKPRRGTAVAGRAALLRGNRALLRLRCLGRGPCRGRGRLTLVAGVTRQFGFRIAGRRSRVVPVALGRHGARALRRDGRQTWRGALAGRGLCNRTVTLRTARSPWLSFRVRLGGGVR